MLSTLRDPQEDKDRTKDPKWYGMLDVFYSTVIICLQIEKPHKSCVRGKYFNICNSLRLHTNLYHATNEDGDILVQHAPANIGLYYLIQTYIFYYYSRMLSYLYT